MLHFQEATEQRAKKRFAERVDIVGPVCETGDCFLRDWPLGEKVSPGEVLAIAVAGAYGMAQSSNYNARCRAAEVLVEGRRTRLIRRRETRDDLLRHDVYVRAMMKRGVAGTSRRLGFAPFQFISQNFKIGFLSG